VCNILSRTLTLNSNFPFAVCGCGDDLNAGHDVSRHRRAGDSQSDNENDNENDNELEAQAADTKLDEHNYLSFGRAFYNLGFRRRGVFRDLDVLAVHPAGTRIQWQNITRVNKYFKSPFHFLLQISMHHSPRRPHHDRNAGN
jgi:hypothetical protein